eukprot:328358_1
MERNQTKNHCIYTGQIERNHRGYSFISLSKYYKSILNTTFTKSDMTKIPTALQVQHYDIFIEIRDELCKKLNKISEKKESETAEAIPSQNKNTNIPPITPYEINALNIDTPDQSQKRLQLTSSLTNNIGLLPLISSNTNNIGPAISFDAIKKKHVDLFVLNIQLFNY